MIKEEITKAPITAPQNLCTEFIVSILEENVPCRTHILQTLDRKSQVTVIYFHGGAYVANVSPVLHLNGVSHIFRTLGHCTFFIPEYPLVPNVGHEELFKTVEAIYRHIVALDASQPIVIMGDSAGGGMTLILAQRLAALRAQGDSVRQPDSVVLLSPWLDVSMSDPACAKQAAVDPILTVSGLSRAGELLAAGPNPVATTDPRVSPLFGSLSGLPPVNVWIGTHDTLLSDSTNLRDRYLKEGVQSRLRYFEKKGLLHVFMLFPFATNDSREEIAHAIREDCGLA